MVLLPAKEALLRVGISPPDRRRNGTGDHRRVCLEIEAHLTLELWLRDVLLYRSLVKALKHYWELHQKEPEHPPARQRSASKPQQSPGIDTPPPFSSSRLERMKHEREERLKNRPVPNIRKGMTGRFRHYN